MISKRKAGIVYTVLFLSLLGACVFLALQVRQYIYENKDQVAPYEDMVLDPKEFLNKIDRKKSLDKNAAMLTFSTTQAFAPLATPVPRPTATPMPAPTATPVVVAKGWKVTNIFSTQFAQMQSFTGQKYTVKPEQVIENRVSGVTLDFKVTEINASQQWVKVQDVKSKAYSILHKESKPRPKSKPKAPPKKRKK